MSIVTATFAALELRVPDTDERLIEGVIVPWGETSFMTPDPRGERFMPGSLTRTIKGRAAGPSGRGHRSRARR